MEFSCKRYLLRRITSIWALRHATQQKPSRKTETQRRMYLHLKAIFPVQQTQNTKVK